MKPDAVLINDMQSIYLIETHDYILILYLYDNVEHICGNLRFPSLAISYHTDNLTLPTFDPSAITWTTVQCSSSVGAEENQGGCVMLVH